MPPKPTSTKLVLNDDGTITVPMKGRVPVTLNEPTMRELAKMHDLAAAADAALPAMPIVSGNSTDPEELEQMQKAIRERQQMVYSEESPHGIAFAQIVEMLSGELVTPDELYGWAMSPRALREVLNHFTAPLGGEDDE